MRLRLVFLACLGFLLGETGCGGPSYGDLKKELEATRYQYRLEQLYVAGLKVQNRQLINRLQELKLKLEDAETPQR